MHMRKRTAGTRRAGMALVAGVALGVSGHAGVAHAQDAGSPNAIQETYQDWLVNCVTPEASEGEAAPAVRLCQMRQELRQAEGNKRVLTMALQPAAEGAGASLTLVAPFGLLLAQPITMDVAGVRVAEVPYRTCLPRGCIATAELGAIDRITTGSEATVSMTTTDGQTLNVMISLAGFADAWTRLLELAEG